MNSLIIRFADLFITGIVAGILFGIWIGYNPKRLSAHTYLEQQQAVIKSLNTLMPLMGLMAIILTIAVAFIEKEKSSGFIVLLIAAGLLIIAGLITKFGNQPINNIIMTWNKTEMPNNWTSLRDRWWFFHTIRMLTCVIAFSLVGWVSTSKSWHLRN